MNKSERLYIRVSPELKEKIQQAAEAENRTLSNWLENLLITALFNAPESKE